MVEAWPANWSLSRGLECWMLVVSGAQWAQVGALDGAAAAGLWSSAKADVRQASTAQCSDWSPAEHCCHTSQILI